MALASVVLTTAMACQPESPPPPPPPELIAPLPEPEWLVELRSRPVVIPPLLPDGECPVSTPALPTPPPPEGSTVSGVELYGTGPMALAAFHSTDGTLPLHPTDDGWQFGATRWTSRVGYRGPVLIRAFRIDGPGRALVELSDPGGSGQPGEVVEVIADWQFWAGQTVVTSPGCYLYQLAGDGFTEYLVLRAEG